LSETSLHFIPYKRRLLTPIFSRTVPGAVALASTALFGVWTLLVRPAAPHAVEPPATGPTATIASNPYGELFDPRFVSGSAPVSLMQSFPLEASLEPIQPAPSVATAEPENVATAEPENVVPMPIPAPPPRQSGSAPLPVPRPAELGSLGNHSPSPAPGRQLAQQNRKPVLPAAPPDNRTFFEKLFGLAQPSGSVLAYAAPEDGISSRARGITSNSAPRYDRWTAVYDVAAHTVYLPNGKRLEAHSGLGNRIDDPRYVNERMRGPTPPNVYELQPREQLFHGVQALRLIPVGNGEVYGRTGLLAHTYMLGPNGDSNGCVSFRDYNEFLRAYQNGEIKRLVVVARL
jgi:Protein of unknown function (DUF2778)